MNQNNIMKREVILFRIPQPSQTEQAKEEQKIITNNLRQHIKDYDVVVIFGEYEDVSAEIVR